MQAADQRNDIVGLRLASQLLTGAPARTPEAVVDRLLAVQAQDGRGARLGVRARSAGLVAADVDRALTVTRSLVVSWLNRGTLHLVASQDYWWLHALTTPRLAAGNERRLRQEGVNPAQAERGVAVVMEAVISNGPQTRPQLRDRLDDAGIPTAGQALVHLLFAASLRANLVRGPVIGSEQGFVSAPDWLGERPVSPDRDEALALLARRYLAGHGPAGPADLAKWAGITIRDARLGFDSMADELTPVGGDLVVASLDEPAPTAPTRLLGAFDELLHGWASREPIVGPHVGVITTNGLFRPVVLVDGRAVGTWSLPGGVVSIRSLEPIPQRVLGALVTDGADVLRFLGLPDKPVVLA